MRTSAIFDAKNFEFFGIYGVSAWTLDKEGLIFRDFVGTSFIDGLLLVYSY